MDEKIAELTRAWLTKAHHDLTGAGRLSADDDAVLDIAIYHCQQRLPCRHGLRDGLR